VVSRQQVKRRSKKGGFEIHGEADLLTSLAKCCKPVPGDDVIGFITRGRGVSVHRKDCKNIVRLSEEDKDRLIDVDWSDHQHQSFEVDIEIEALDRAGLLRDVTSVLSGEDVNVLSANTHTNRKTQEARMRLTLEVDSSSKLNSAVQKLAQLRNVLEVNRIT
jgi:GTP pyrophosphokinase